MAGAADSSARARERESAPTKPLRRDPGPRERESAVITCTSIGGGVHVAMRGDFLKVHADHNWHYKLYTHRRVNALLYLSQKDWSEDWGGHLEMWDEDMTGPQSSIAPFFNRLVVFETTDKTNHGRPNPLECPEGVFRKALNLYYYTSKRDEAETTDPDFSFYR